MLIEQIPKTKDAEISSCDKRNWEVGVYIEKQLPKRGPIKLQEGILAVVSESQGKW